MSVTTAYGVETSAPNSAMTYAAGTASGSLGNGNYRYLLTYYYDQGETTPCPVGSAVNPNPATSMNITALQTSRDSHVLGRKIYRTAAGGSAYLLLATIADNTTTTYTDIIADGSLGAAVPEINTAQSISQILGFTKLTNPMVSEVIAVTAGTTQTQAGATRVGLNQFAAVTTGNANDGVALPLLNSGLIGMSIYVSNLSANALRVYPNTGQTINSGTVNVHVTHAASIGRWYVSTTAANWVQV